MRGFCQRRRLFQSSMPPVAVIPPAVAPPDSAVLGDVMLLGEAASDGPTTLKASLGLDKTWTNSGGDWLDANGVAQGTTAYASATISVSSPGQAITWTITSLIQALLTQTDGNTGIYLIPSPSSDTGSAFATHEHVTVGLRPQFHIETTVGTYDVGSSKDASVTNTSQSSGELDEMRQPYVIKPNLAGVTGTVTLATMTLYTLASSQTIPCTIKAYLLKMPALIHDPVRQLGGQVLGIAQGGEVALAVHSSVVWYHSFTDLATFNAGWSSAGSGATPVGTPTFVSWPEFGITTIRLASPQPGDGTDGVSILTRRKDVSIGNYTELYVRYLLMIDGDAAQGLNPVNTGTKLPGLGNDLLDDVNGFSYRLRHTQVSAANPDAYGHSVHAYDFDNPFSTAAAQDRRTDFTFEADRHYCIEQYVKMNTKTGATYNADGVQKIWVDGVLVYTDTNRRIQGAGPTLHPIGDFFANFFHGGTAHTLAAYHYEFGGVCIATEYIGPPSPLPYTIPAQGQFKNISLNTILDVEACPAHNCVYTQQGVENIFGAWASGDYLSSYSAHGALIVYGGGHNAYSGNETYAFNLATALWERNRTPSEFTELQADPVTLEFPDGQPIAAHTYAGVAAMPASWYGGTKGKYARFGVAGTPNSAQYTHIINLDDTPNASWSRFTALITINSSLSTYNAVARDDGRQGFWLVTAGGGDRTLFIDKNGVITTYMVFGTWFSRASMAYSPTLDLLVLHANGPGTPTDHYTLHVMRANDPMAGWTVVNFTGLGPLDNAQNQGNGEQSASCGLEWSSILGKFVSYPGRGTSKVYILTPGANPLVDPWAWTSETLTGEAGATPTVTTSIPENGHWGRFREVPSLKCFVWADSASQAAQLWRPTGMV